MLPAAIALTGLLAVPVVVALHMMAEPTSPDQPRFGIRSRAQVLAGFDGERAYGYLVEQCKLGPRRSGTEANLQLRRRIAEHFKSCGAKVEVQSFSVPHPTTGEAVEMANVLGRWFPERSERVLIAAHFDTRPHPDNETNPRRRKLPFVGANDGASGVAVLMELAHMIPELGTRAGVDLVAFDGEELVYGQVGEYFLGSRYFAEQYHKTSTDDGLGYLAAIVVDMVGGNRLQLKPDRLSLEHSADLVREVWDVARRLRVRAFRDRGGYDIRDDHEPLIEAGIRAIDIIDFDYMHWHLASDTPNQCSARSLAWVGGVVAEWLRSQ